MNAMLINCTAYNNVSGGFRVPRLSVFSMNVMGFMVYDIDWTWPS